MKQMKFKHDRGTKIFIFSLILIMKNIPKSKPSSDIRLTCTHFALIYSCSLLMRQSRSFMVSLPLHQVSQTINTHPSTNCHPQAALHIRQRHFSRLVPPHHWSSSSWNLSKRSCPGNQCPLILWGKIIFFVLTFNTFSSTIVSSKRWVDPWGTTAPPVALDSTAWITLSLGHLHRLIQWSRTYEEDIS